MKKILIPALMGLSVLAGCATQSVYAPADSGRTTAAGYSESKLTDNRYRVTFTGNTSTPSATVKDYALLRSAELTLQQGYDWFTVVNRDLDRKTSSTTTGADTIVYPQTQVYQSCGLLGCRTAVATAPGFSAPDLATTSTSTAYSQALEIVMGKGATPSSGDSYNARQLANSIRERMQTARK